MNEKWLFEQYVINERSVGDIAKELKTYPNKVRRALVARDIKLRDKGQAQAVALKSGRSRHPTKGVGHSEQAKLKISEKVAENWENLSDDELEARRESARQQWKNMSEADKIRLREAATPAIQKAAKEGSKLEKYICERLTKAGYVIEYHRHDLVPNEKLEVDIYLPDLGTAIEIDGPAHFLPLYGEETLRRTIISDNEKNGLLRYTGFVVLRVAQRKKTLSKKTMRDTWDAIEIELKKIAKKLPPKDQRYKEIEV
jgi:very-short-patch-repair endonuclease